MRYAALIMIPAGQLGTTVSVTVKGDLWPESDETLLVTLGSPSGTRILDGQAIGTIRNDD
jgi:hypothetical protein